MIFVKTQEQGVEAEENGKRGERNERMKREKERLSFLNPSVEFLVR